MARKREKPEEIASKLRQVEVLQGQGVTIAETVRPIGVTQQMYYRRRELYGGMQLSKELGVSERRKLARIAANSSSSWSDRSLRGRVYSKIP